MTGVQTCALPICFPVTIRLGGEYGSTTKRPHFHACIFGWDFSDRLYFKRTESGEIIYTSRTLERLWPYGFSSIGNVTFQSAAYIARYCTSKVTGDAAKIHYRREDENGEYFLTPEFSHMSLKPAIGKTWLEKYKNDVYNHDYVIVNGVKATRLFVNLYQLYQSRHSAFVVVSCGLS